MLYNVLIKGYLSYGDSMKNRKRYVRFSRNMKKLHYMGMELSFFKCPYCERNAFLFDRYDSKCCFYCNEWLEETCSDPECPLCSMRPENPWGAYFYMRETLSRYSQKQRKDRLRLNYQHKHDGEKRILLKKTFYQNPKNKY